MKFHTKAYLDDPWNASNILNIVFLTKLKKAAVVALLKNTYILEFVATRCLEFFM